MQDEGQERFEAESVAIGDGFGAGTVFNDFEDGYVYTGHSGNVSPIESESVPARADAAIHTGTVGEYGFRNAMGFFESRRDRGGDFVERLFRVPGERI